MAISLFVAACDYSADNAALPQEPVSSPVGERRDTPVPADPEVERKADAESVPAAVDTREKLKPLDLSLPPQPAVAPRRPGDEPTSSEPILPDLFTLDQQDDRSMQLKGQMLMEEGSEASLETLEGGQLTIEMKTR